MSDDWTLEDEFRAQEAARNGAPANDPTEVSEAVRRFRVQEAARAVVADERARSLFVAPPSTLDLSSELAIEDGPLAYTVAEFHPTGSNGLLVAQYKTGKTTLSLNFTKALADHEPFLGRFETNLEPGRRVAWLNYELSDAQARSWLRKLGIQHLENVSVLHLRGYHLPLWEEATRAWLRDWLIERNVAFIIADPVARALAGLSENSNDDLTRFTEAFDILKREANVPDSLAVTHTGRAFMEEGEERARGATRLDDWADVRWVFTRARSGNQRFISATGRDVEVSEFGLAFDPETLRLSPLGFAVGRQVQGTLNMAERIAEAVRAEPGVNTTRLKAMVTGKAALVVQGIEMAESLGTIRIEVDGQTKKHFPLQGGLGQGRTAP